VLITGGEPLLQESELFELVNKLRAKDVLVEIETNGSIAPPWWWTMVTSWSADIKCPSSGMCGKSNLAWLGTRTQDQVKFVVQTEEDLNFARRTYKACYLGPTVLISPTYPWSTEWLQRCVEFCKETSTRLSLQQQKIIFGERRGV
jgi:organic radical activating enzyme